MTKEEWKKKRAQIPKDDEKALHLLDLQFTAANNPYQIGDYVTDHFHTIKIEIIKYGFRGWGKEFPCCIYYGKGTKGGSSERIYQYNVID